jgi:hypothetical protein
MAYWRTSRSSSSIVYRNLLLRAVRISLSALTQTLTAAFALVHSFEATYYLIYHAAQTVQATWVTYDRARTDPIQMAFYRAMQLKTAAYMRHAVALCVKVRELPRAIAKMGVTVHTLCTVTKSVDGRAAEAHVCRGTLDAQQPTNFVDQVSTEAKLVCTSHQLSEAHKLRFVLEADKRLYTLLKAARNSGEPFYTRATIVATDWARSSHLCPYRRRSTRFCTWRVRQQWRLS